MVVQVNSEIVWFWTKINSNSTKLWTRQSAMKFLNLQIRDILLATQYVFLF